MAKENFQILKVDRRTQDLYGDQGMLRVLRKAQTEVADSNQSSMPGRVWHLLNKKVARDMRDFNAHHLACLDAKETASLALGHRDEEIHDVLDPLCQFSWQDTLNALAKDFFEGGDAMLEVARNDPKDPAIITGLFHLDAAQTYVHLETFNDNREFHYAVDGHMMAGESVVLARFGDLAKLKARFTQAAGQRRRPGRPRTADQGTTSFARAGTALSGRIVNSEVIHIRQSTNRSPWYGYPDYMAGVPSIELVQMMTQHEFDFFLNRGVPEFLLFLISETALSKTCWDEISAVLKSGQGLGASRKSGAFNIPVDPEKIEVILHKLALEHAEDARAYQARSDVEAMKIASAHGVPPILASLLISGKMGANNEGPNALLLFQKRKINPIQRIFSAAFAATLGRPGQKFAQPEGSPKTLSRDQFLGKGQGMTDEDGMPQHVSPGNGFRTVLDGMSLGAIQTLSTMREPVAGSSRDLNQGRLESQSDRPRTDPRGRGTRGGVQA